MVYHCKVLKLCVKECDKEVYTNCDNCDEIDKFLKRQKQRYKLTRKEIDNMNSFVSLNL